jgi:hypothetical protein
MRGSRSSLAKRRRRKWDCRHCITGFASTSERCHRTVARYHTLKGWTPSFCSLQTTYKVGAVFRHHASSVFYATDSCRPKEPGGATRCRLLFSICTWHTLPKERGRIFPVSRRVQRTLTFAGQIRDARLFVE